VSQAIARGDTAALNYFVAQQYLKAFTELARSPNQKVIMLPIETMGVLGSLAGIAEIAKSSLGDGKGSPPSGRPGGPVTTTVPSTRPV
jgi:hypothetical protein